MPKNDISIEKGITKKKHMDSVLCNDCYDTTRNMGNGNGLTYIVIHNLHDGFFFEFQNLYS